MLQNIIAYYYKYKTQFNAFFLALFALLVAVSGYEVGQQNPEPELVVQAIRRTEVARPTHTPTPDRRVTHTPIPVTFTATPPLTPTLPTATPAPETATPTATPTSLAQGHDVTLWHAPGVAGHQHGLDWRAAHPEVVAWLENHAWGPLFTSIGSLWPSSPLENLYPWPLGKHEGFVNLGELDTHCDLYKQPPETSGACIKAYLFQVHALGNAEEFFARVHSDKLVALVCDRETESQCGIVATGGLADYGERHALYKQAICPLDSNPPYPPQYSVNQPPYITVNGTARQFVFWSSLTNPVIHPYFDTPPNQLFQAAWNQRPFSTVSLEDCTDPGSFLHHTNLENRNNTFQVFLLKLNLADFPRPFEGYTDVHGVLAPACTAPSASCIPLYIGANVPAGDALLNRNTRHGDPEAAPIQQFGDADTLLVPPGGPLP